MNTRLKQFLAAENITQAQFADRIRVVRASVSHILSGRNNPSFDFIKAMMTHYPNLNMEWLIFGKGKMYKDTAAGNAESLFIEETIQQRIPTATDADYLTNEAVPSVGTMLPEQTPTETYTLDAVPEHSTKQKKAVKIIIMYNDGSYQEL